MARELLRFILCVLFSELCIQSHNLFGRELIKVPVAQCNAVIKLGTEKKRTVGMIE
jgi:hypothetical protein